MIAAPEVGPGVILPFGDDRAADRAGAGEMAEQGVAVADADCSLQRAIRVGDGEALFDQFTRTRAIRRSIIAEGQDDARPDFGRGDHGGAG